MRAAALLALSLCAMPVIAPIAGTRESAGDAELARLEQAAAAHPDDPDLQWALSMALADRGLVAEAADRLEGFVSRWPERRSDARLQLGRARYEAGRDHAALNALEAAIELDPVSGPAHFYRALALRRLGRLDEADAELRIAAYLEPDLRAEALLLRGLDQLERRRDDEARELLRHAAELDSTGEIAQLARVVLRGAPPRDADRRLSLFASTGFELDSNVTLESDSGLPGAVSDERDTVWVGSAGFRARALRGERGRLDLGYRVAQSRHSDLDAYDQQSHALFGAATWQASEHVLLRLDGAYAMNLLDRRSYSNTASAQPSLFVGIGGGRLLRLHGEMTWRDYRDDPAFSSLQRDGISFGGGAGLYTPLSWHEEAWLWIGARVASTQTAAAEDLLGFRGDYDNLRSEARARAHIPGPLGFALDASLRAAHDRYTHHNLVDALTDDGVGTTNPDRRRDTILDARLSVTRALTRWVTADLAWRYTRQISNVDVYDYDRHVLGFYMRTQF